MSAGLKARSLERIRCSFCGKRGTEVRKIISGQTPKVAICDECVALCVEIIAEQDSPDPSEGP